jgi:hypothetical protein
MSSAKKRKWVDDEARSSSRGDISKEEKEASRANPFEPREARDAEDFDPDSLQREDDDRALRMVKRMFKGDELPPNVDSADLCNEDPLTVLRHLKPAFKMSFLNILSTQRLSGFVEALEDRLRPQLAEEQYNALERLACTIDEVRCLLS